MEDISSLWTFHEIEELKEKLQYKTYELEITRKEANEEMKRKNEHVKKLHQLLQTTIKERDEAKAQLQKLQQQVPSFNNNNNQFISATGPFSPDSPLLTNFQGRTNSGITESNNSLSIETNNINNNNNNQNRVSSPVVDSVSYPRSATSSDSSNIGLSGSIPTTSMMTTPTPTPTPTPTTTKVVVVDQASLIIDNLAKNKPRPQKGKLLQAVLEAGPLLQTLLVAGSLPRWRNPPGSLTTTHQIPPVNIKGCVSNVGSLAHNKNVGDYYGLVTGGSLGVCPTSMLDFGGGSSGGSCLMGGRLMNSGVNFDYQIPKRQRLL